MKTTSRDAWWMDRPGLLTRLHRRRDSLPPPAAGEARIAVAAIGLNFADVFASLGLYSATPAGPFVPGLEFAGLVEELGPDRRDDRRLDDEAVPESAAVVIKPGDRVMGMTRFGGYATALNVDRRALHPVPAGWSVADAAAFPVQALTAWYGLVDRAALAAGDVVLVHSAAGGVGLHALAIAAARGATVVATIGCNEKRAVLEGRGVASERVIVRHRHAFGRQLDAALHASGAAGVNVVFDAIMGPYFAPGWSRLRPEGRYVLYGAADFMPPGDRAGYLRLGLRYLRRPRVDPLEMIAANRSLIAFNLIWLWDALDRMPAAYAALGVLRREPPVIGRRFRFDDIPAAMRFLQSGTSIGKVIVEV